MRRPGMRFDKVITERHKYKIVLDVILEFLHQIPDDEFLNPEKPNFCTKDFSLEQFHWYIARRMDILNERDKWRHKDEDKLIEK